MQFTYEQNSGESILIIKDDVYKYLIKARRHKINDEIYFRNLKDSKIYLYKLVNISKKDATFQLISSEEKVINNNKKIHIGWCLVDPKTIEKNIASLNELGVDKITFIYCEYSQKNFKINIEKLEKILINSSSQCGRSDIIKLEVCKTLDDFLAQNDEVYFLDFSSSLVDEKKDKIKTIVVGCEGGFSSDERNDFNPEYIVGFNSNLILKSETAAISLSSKILI